jgi:hypothetical protein
MATVLISVPTAVWASHQFTDVPDSHIFHTGISWMKDNNITVGCNPPANTQYCPDDNVTRGQMATFMKRLAENNVVDAATLDGKDSTELLTVASAQTFDWFDAGTTALPAAGSPIVETTVTAPAAGHLIVTGTATFGNAFAGVLLTVWLELDDGACGIALSTPDNSIPGAVSYMSNDGNGDDGAAAVSSLVAVTAGDHTVTLCGASGDGTGSAFNATVIAQSVGEGSVTALSGVASSGGDGGPQG